MSSVIRKMERGRAPIKNPSAKRKTVKAMPAGRDEPGGRCLKLSPLRLATLRKVGIKRAWLHPTKGYRLRRSA